MSDRAHPDPYSRRKSEIPSVHSDASIQAIEHCFYETFGYARPTNPAALDEVSRTEAAHWEGTRLDDWLGRKPTDPAPIEVNEAEIERRKEAVRKALEKKQADHV